jgi:hypothetical protein
LRLEAGSPGTGKSTERLLKKVPSGISKSTSRSTPSMVS